MIAPEFSLLHSIQKERFLPNAGADPSLKVSQSRFQWQSKNDKEHREPELGIGAGLCKAVDVETWRAVGEAGSIGIDSWHGDRMA